MSEDLVTNIITEFFQGGWRVAPFIKTANGYLGVKSWPKRAASNMIELQALIEEWAEKSSKVPIYGVVPPKGRYVVDIDTKKNSSALQLWRERVIEATGDDELAMPQLVVKTKSGGFHLYYSDGSDKSINSPTAVFGKDSGVDIRGYTGMVVAPSSVGSERDWVFGEYVVIRGKPSDPSTVLSLAKVTGQTEDSEDVATKQLLREINEALRNDSVHELYRHKLLPPHLVIPASTRDNTLFRCAKLCRMAGLSQEAANQFMVHAGMMCETSPEEPVEHWVGLAREKVRRIYAHDADVRLRSVTALYDELDNAGTVLLRGVSKSYYYFRFGSKALKIDPRARYSVENIGNVVQGLYIAPDEGDAVPIRRVIGSYEPRDVAYNAAMYPKDRSPFFDFEGQYYVNTYHDPFSSFEPDPGMLQDASKFVEKFVELTRHITGYEDGDADHLLNKLAWIVQKPYRKLPTGTIIYSHTRGSGKDVYMTLVREVIGRAYYMPITLSTLESDFSSFHEKLVCTASEVQLQANARGTIAAASFMGRLKDVITARTVLVNEKYQQPFTAPIFTNFFLLSNFELSTILEPGDRRFDVFHATEEKLNQDQFGELADLGNDGIWADRGSTEQLFRKHCIYAIRLALQQRRVMETFDRQEAAMNVVKQNLMEHHNPPSVEWMFNNLPTYFTEDVAMFACYVCPTRANPEYIMKQLKEHFGPRMRPLYRRQSIIHRMAGAPKLVMKSNGSTNTPTLEFYQTSNPIRKAVYSLSDVRSAHPTDGDLRTAMKNWYDRMISTYFGGQVHLPGQVANRKLDDLI